MISISKNKLLLTSIVLIFTLSCQQKKNTFNICDYGASADTATINTIAIQKTIDACAANGGGQVIVPKGAFITGTILLKSHVNLHLNEGASLIGSTNPNDYISIDPFVDATGQPRGKCLIGAIDANHVSISGKGIIQGQGTMFTPQKIKETIKKLKGDANADDKTPSKNLFERPFLVRLVRTTNISVQGIKLINPAAWTLHLYQCGHFTIDGIKIYSHANRNNDGIDVDSSTNGVIKNCDIDSGDDAICFKTTSPLPTENIRVRDCRIKSNWGAIKIGTESMGDFSDVSVKDCLIHDTRGGGIKLLSADGANIERVSIDNIKMENVDMPLFIRLGERLRVYRDAPKQTVGSMENISITNLTAIAPPDSSSRVKPPTGIFITGTTNHRIESVKLVNIHIQLPGGGNAKDAQTIVPEDDTAYPEYTKFGKLPAYGLYARHIDSLQIKNVSFALISKDKRKEIILKDVQNQMN